MKKSEMKINKVSPLSVITDDEAKTVAKTLKVKLNLIEKKHKELTTKDPQLLFSTHKSKEFLEKRIKK
jgi:hypothetical protein